MKWEVDVFLEFSCLTYDPVEGSNLISGLSAFSKSSLNICKFLVHVWLKPGLKNFEHYLASMWNELNCVVFWVFCGMTLLWDWNENWHFPVLENPVQSSPVPLVSFPNLLEFWMQHFDSIIFFEIAQSEFHRSFVRNNTFQGPPDFTLQDIWLYLSDHTIMVIWVIKIFFI